MTGPDGGAQESLAPASHSPAPPLVRPAPGAPAIRVHCGFDIVFECPTALPILLTLSVHPSRRGDLETPDWLRTDPPIPVGQYIDGYGNICSRILAPPGRLGISADFIIRDTGLIDDYAPNARQHEVADLPDDVILFLLGSRYCETDRLSEAAWSLFGKLPAGWGLVQAVTDYVHNHITFDEGGARPDKTTHDVWVDGRGVCRDYAHLAIAFCRCLNIPARYCTGYLGDIGVPVVGAMDFSAWFEVYLGGAWRTFDARNNMPRMARVLIAHGRDAVDVPIAHTFGPAQLADFSVFSAEAAPVQSGGDLERPGGIEPPTFSLGS